MRRLRGVSMLEGWEWLIIGVVAIVLILWGPSKIPEFAKALGRAKGEFKKAQKDSDAALATNTGPAVKSRDEILLETARNLGISTDGKTREEISDDIALKVKLMGSAA
jgi:sec-independent protein translocase protein TatA